MNKEDSAKEKMTELNVTQAGTPIVSASAALKEADDAMTVLKETDIAVTALDSKKIIIKVSKVSIAINILLTVLKLVVGLISSSTALVADAVHSASDVLGSFLVIIGAHIAGKEADAEHPYGHERLECLISFILASILLLVGAGIGWQALQRIISTDAAAFVIPGALALAAAAISIVVKEALFWYTKVYADKINSVSLRAEAWHHRSDALSSIGSFAGIGGALLGYPILDPVAGIIICLFILKVAFSIYKESFDKLVDRACSSETSDKIAALVLEQAGVERIDDLKTRLSGSRVYVDVEIAVCGELSLLQAHSIAEQVHHAIENSFAEVKHCMVHVNPLERSVCSQAASLTAAAAAQAAEEVLAETAPAAAVSAVEEAPAQTTARP